MARVFRDAEGREWTLTIDPAALVRLAGAGINLPAMLADSFGQALRDYVLICDALYLLCKDQADGRGVTDEDFGRGLTGDVLDEALEALALAFADSLPGKAGKHIASQLKAGKAMEKRLLADLLRQPETLPPIEG